MIERKKKICKGCTKEDYLFGKGLCKLCYTKENFKPIISKVKPRRVSDSQKSKNKEYSFLRKQFLVRFPICQCCGMKHSTEIHHKAGRDGDNLFKYFLAVCRTCHIRIEEQPIWAKENGHSITRLN